jgi:hypothetical protein
LAEEPSGHAKPALDHLTISIHELNKIEIRLQLEESRGPCVSCPSRGKWRIRFERYDIGTQPSSHIGGPVRRAGVHIDDAPGD